MDALKRFEGANAFGTLAQVKASYPIRVIQNNCLCFENESTYNIIQW